VRNAFLKLSVKRQLWRDALKNEDGQDLIEYALVVALVALAATAGMNSLATGINTAFNHLATRLTTIIP
jgi:pilus assembly protein Flp/PilA